MEMRVVGDVIQEDCKLCVKAHTKMHGLELEIDGKSGDLLALAALAAVETALRVTKGDQANARVKMNLIMDAVWEMYAAQGEITRIDLSGVQEAARDAGK